MTEFIGLNWISIIAAIIGLCYLYFEYKANIWMWPVSILMSVFYIYIFYSTKLYASMGIYIYFSVASVYGWGRWLLKDRHTDTGAHIITRMKKNYIAPLIAAVIFIFAIIYFFLLRYSTDQGGVTIGDALATSLNIVSLWMASRKWAEQWLLLIPANIISCGLLYVQGDIMSTCLFVIFFIVSILGYSKWKKIVFEHHSIILSRDNEVSE